MTNEHQPFLVIYANHCYFCFKPHGSIKGRNIHMAKIHPQEYRAMRKRVSKLLARTKAYIGAWTHSIEIPK